MDKLRLTLLFAFCAALAITSCKKDDSPPSEPELELPPYTHEGKNLLAFKLDGKPVIMNVHTVLFDPTVHSGFQIVAATEDQKLGMRWWGVYTGLDTPLTVDQGNPLQTMKWATLLIDPTNTSAKAQPDSGKTNRVKFQHFDSSVLAGSFQFTLKYFDTGRPVNPDSTLLVTDGRFDFKVP